MTRKGGRDEVKDGVKNAKVVELRPGAATASPRTAVSLASWRFNLEETGLWRRNDDPTRGPLWVCGWLEPGLETRNDEARSWGMLLAWLDRDGTRHEEIFARPLFNGECTELRSKLADGGLSLGQSQAARQAFIEYVNTCSSDKRARSVGRIGWHSVGKGSVFVLDDTSVFGEADERVVLHLADHEVTPFEVAGTLEDWARSLGHFCIGNSRLTFAASCAFAAPLLGLMGEEGGGFNLRGKSSAGKSTVLAVAASVCGGTAQGGARGFIRSWRATSNGIEGIALASCDTLLLLDEMSQVDAKEAGEIAYTLGNGVTKARSGRSGQVRPVSRFRSLFLSTGEVGIADKNREAGRMTRAGQEVRLADIPADAGQGHGVFDHVHDSASAVELVKEIRAASATCYGQPLRSFLDRLLGQVRERGPDLSEDLRSRADKIVARWLDAAGEASGQVKRLAFRFALVAVAGELATEWEITGWPHDGASWAAECCFRAWLEERGTLGSREDVQAVTALRQFIALNGNSQFEDVRDRKSEDGAYQGDQEDAPPPVSARVVVNRAGWRIWERQEDGSSGWSYLIIPDVLRHQVLAGLDFRASVQILGDRGFFRRDSQGKTSVARRIPGVSKRARVYDVPGRIIGGNDLHLEIGDAS